MRMQPDDTLVPIVQGSFEPWLRLTRRSVVRLLLIDALLLIAALLIVLALRAAIAEQEFDEAAAHVGGGSHRCGLRSLAGVDHGGFGQRRGVDCAGPVNSRAKGSKEGSAAKQRQRHCFEHRRTLYCFVLNCSCRKRRSAPRTVPIKIKTASVW